MRGGDTLANECVWMIGICSRLYHSTGESEIFSYRCPSSVFFANRFRSADCQKIQLPLGGSQGMLTLYFCYLSNRSIPSTGGRLVAAPTTAAAEPPTGRLLVDPYSGRITFNQVLSALTGRDFTLFFIYYHSTRNSERVLKKVLRCLSVLFQKYMDNGRQQNQKETSQWKPIKPYSSGKK